MRVAWTILLISAITDAMIVAGTAWTALAGSGQPINRTAIITVVIGGIIAAARTVQNALKTTPETAAALKGDQSRVETTTVSKTP